MDRGGTIAFPPFVYAPLNLYRRVLAAAHTSANGAWKQNVHAVQPNEPAGIEFERKLSGRVDRAGCNVIYCRTNSR